MKETMKSAYFPKFYHLVPVWVRCSKYSLLLMSKSPALLNIHLQMVKNVAQGRMCEHL